MNALKDAQPSRLTTDGMNEIIKALEGQYGVPAAGIIDPVDLLVQTILSQNTSDLNSGRAFRSLKVAYPDSESILAAPGK